MKNVLKEGKATNKEKLQKGKDYYQKNGEEVSKMLVIYLYTQPNNIEKEGSIIWKLRKQEI